MASDPQSTAADAEQRWLTPGVRGIGAASFLADVGHEIPTALLPNLLTVTLGAPLPPSASSRVSPTGWPAWPDSPAPCLPCPGRPGRRPHRHRPVHHPGLLAALAIVYAIRRAPRAEQRNRQPLRGDRRGAVLVLALGVGLFGLVYASPQQSTMVSSRDTISSMEAGNDVTGELAIDLANTLRLARNGSILDLLADEDALARWLRVTGGPDVVEASALAALRDHVRALLAAAVSRRTLPPAAVTAVNRAAAAAPGFAQLEAGELVVRNNASPADTFLADIAASAIGLVGGPERDRLRRCQAPGCGRWFLASRPRQAWCSPGCGNRARLARFHQRRRVA